MKSRSKSRRRAGTPQPQVTVIIPTHNHRRALLMEALQTVMDQTYQDWHVIVVDNNSCDGTSEAVEALDHDRIELVCHPTNLGPGGGRNTGINRAQTPFIAFLDSDDLWRPHFLKRVMELATDHPEICFFSARAELFKIENGHIPLWEKTPTESLKNLNVNTLKILGITTDTDPCQSVAERLLRLGNYFATSTVVARTDAVRALGGFDPALQRSEDTDMWLRLALRYPSVHLSETLAKIRLHPGQTQAPESRLEKLQRRIYICSKALSLMEDGQSKATRLLRRRLRVSWRECARILSEQQQWEKAAYARGRQWRLRPLDFTPLFQWAGCRLHAQSQKKPKKGFPENP